VQTVFDNKKKKTKNENGLKRKRVPYRSGREKWFEMETVGWLN
jgi:hypothetical protein